MKSKMDAPAATTATAHKIAIIFYTMVKEEVEYDASLWAQRDATDPIDIPAAGPFAAPAAG